MICQSYEVNNYILTLMNRALAINRHKKPKEDKELPLAYINGVKAIFLHPSHYYYVLICHDGYLRIFDISTMSVVVEHIQNLSSIKSIDEVKCVFHPNTNIFCLITPGLTLKMYQVTLGRLKCTSELKLELPQSETMIECSPILLPTLKIEILTQAGIFVYSINEKCPSPGSIPFFEPIVSGIPINPHTWMIASDTLVSISVFKYEDNMIEESNIKIQGHLSQRIRKNTSFVHHQKKHLVGFLSEQKFLCFLQYSSINLTMDILFRIPYDRTQNIKWSNFFSFGVSSSTTNKFQNKVLFLISSEIQSHKMIDEKREEEDITLCHVSIFTLDIQLQVWCPELDNKDSKDHTIIKQLELAQSVWECEMISSKLSYLNSKGEVLTLDMCYFLEGNGIGKEWVNLGFRFQALPSNSSYQEVPKQFQKQDLNGQIKLNQIELDDWSYSILPKHLIVTKTIGRLSCFDF